MLVKDFRGRTPDLAVRRRKVPGTIRAAATQSPTVRGAALPYEANYLDFGAMEVTAQLLNLCRVLPEQVAWGKQVGDGIWQDVQPMMVNMVRVSDEKLNQLRQATFGHSAGNIAILSNRPSRISTLEQAFFGTPWRFQDCVGVSIPLQNRMRPVVRFLAVGIERELEDHEGGGKGADALARELGGIPAVIYATDTTVWRAGIEFQAALQETLGVI